MRLQPCNDILDQPALLAGDAKRQVDTARPKPFDRVERERVILARLDRPHHQQRSRRCRRLPHPVADRRLFILVRQCIAAEVPVAEMPHPPARERALLHQLVELVRDATRNADQRVAFLDRRLDPAAEPVGRARRPVLRQLQRKHVIDDSLHAAVQVPQALEQRREFPVARPGRIQHQQAIAPLQVYACITAVRSFYGRAQAVHVEPVGRFEQLIALEADRSHANAGSCAAIQPAHDVSDYALDAGPVVARGDVAHVDQDPPWREQRRVQARMQRARGRLGQPVGAIGLRQDATNFADHDGKRYRGLACDEFVDEQRELGRNALAAVLAHYIVTSALAQRRE